MVDVPLVAVIIVHWGSPKMTLECIQSLSFCQYRNLHIIVVDNYSEEKLSQHAFDVDHNITYIRCATNTGYCGGNNIGILEAQKLGAKYILLLNNDTIVDKEFLHTCVDYLECHPVISVISAKVLFYDNPEYINVAGGELDINTGERIVFGENEKDTGQCESEKEITWATGCAFFSNAYIFEKIGLFDEKLFCYCEDDDISRRIVLANLRMRYLPNARVWHKHPNVKVIGKGGVPSSFLMYYYWRNRLYNLRRYLSKDFAKIYVRFSLKFIWSLMACALKHRRPDISLAMILGLFDSIVGRMGKRDYSFIQPMYSRIKEIIK